MKVPSVACVPVKADGLETAPGSTSTTPSPKVRMPAVDRFVFAGRLGCTVPHRSIASAACQLSVLVGATDALAWWSRSLRE